MKCPKCGENGAGVVDSRDALDGLSIRRRRQCKCGHRWTTYEIEMELQSQGRTRKGSTRNRQMLGQIAGRRIVGDAYDEIV